MFRSGYFVYPYFLKKIRKKNLISKEIERYFKAIHLLFYCYGINILYLLVFILSVCKRASKYVISFYKIKTGISKFVNGFKYSYRSALLKAWK